MKTASWVIVSTNQAVMETSSHKVADAVNLDKYRVVSILAWLVSLNSEQNHQPGGGLL